jgi:hypothetical protein
MVPTDDTTCMAATEAENVWQDGGGLRCLTGQDLAKFDYISVGHDGFIPVNVKPMEMIRLGNVTR